MQKIFLLGFLLVGFTESIQMLRTEHNLQHQLNAVETPSPSIPAVIVNKTEALIGKGNVKGQGQGKGQG